MAAKDNHGICALPVGQVGAEGQNGALLIAGCGDLGERLAERVWSHYRIYGLRRESARLAPKIMPISADLADPASLRALPPAITHVVFCPTPDARSEAAYRRVFVDGLQALIGALADAGAKVERVLMVSSSAVYGEHNGSWVDERTPCVPLASNGAVLLEAERWLERQRLPAVTLRLAGIYGPGRKRLLQDIQAGRARCRAIPPFYTNRVHVDDAAAALAHVLALRDPARCYNVVDSAPTPQCEVYDWLAARLGAPAPARGPEPVGVGSKRISNARLRATGFVPVFSDYRAGYGALLPRPCAA